MKTCIALFRGINVGGNNILPMKELVVVLESIDLYNIKTYIQSGNVLFQSNAKNETQLSAAISSAIKKSHGFEPKVMLLNSIALKKVIKANPFVKAEAVPNTLHIGFMISIPDHPDIQSLEKIRAENERFQIIGNAFYLHAPEGIGQSKLATQVEKILGVPMTMRNWRTVSKLMEMVRESN
jgi:uncharacterized protein (DUF1697 family)